MAGAIAVAIVVALVEICEGARQRGTELLPVTDGVGEGVRSSGPGAPRQTGCSILRIVTQSSEGSNHRTDITRFSALLSKTHAGIDAMHNQHYCQPDVFHCARFPSDRE